jgi:DnaJ-class molecular chaperone
MPVRQPRIPFNRVGAKFKVLCPTCDGNKKNPDKIEEDCPDCKGIGELEAEVVKQ